MTDTISLCPRCREQTDFFEWCDSYGDLCIRCYDEDRCPSGNERRLEAAYDQWLDDRIDEARGK